jgi:hypothetical protein
MSPISCTKLYIAGPMRGYPNLNFDAFHDAADRFRRLGYTVRNPVEIGREEFGPDASAVSPAEFLRADLRIVIDCAAIALLPGWERSTGAKIEAAVAVALGHTFYDALTLEEMPTPALIQIRGGYERPVELPPDMLAPAASPSSEGARQ